MVFLGHTERNLYASKTTERSAKCLVVERFSACDWRTGAGQGRGDSGGAQKRSLSPLAAGGDPRITRMLGVAYYSANDHARALEKLGPVLDKFPKESIERREAVQLMALSHYILGHLEEAIPFLEQTREWLPQNQELSYALGMAYLQVRQPDKARESIARMFRVEPAAPAAYLLTAQMMVRLELSAPAEAELKTALEKDPRLPGANYMLGQIAVSKGKYEEGVALMERELAVNPGNANAYYKIGDAYTQQLKWDEAIVVLQKSIWLNPYYSGPYILLGKAYLKKKQLGSAESMLKHAIQFDPNNKTAHYLLSQVYLQSNRLEDAKRELSITKGLVGGVEGVDKEKP
jgi:cytochrome c-type biogenesis protein CcmH/NrfG